MEMPPWVVDLHKVRPDWQVTGNCFTPVFLSLGTVDGFAHITLRYAAALGTVGRVASRSPSLCTR